MPIESKLTRNGRVIYQHYLDPLDMRDVLAHFQKYQSEILDHATAPVHIITDTSGLSRLPSHILSGGMSTIRHSHPMGGQIVIVAQGGFINAMAQVFQRMAKNQPVTVVHTLDEAWVYVDKLLASESAGTNG